MLEKKNIASQNNNNHSIRSNGTTKGSIKIQDRISEIRSDDVQEILNHVPNWMIRWGITFIFILIGLLLFLSWLIQYPDVISGDIIITTQIPPTKLVSKMDGRIQKLHVEEGEYVNKGDFIAEIENPLNEKTIQYLENIISKITANFLLDTQNVKNLKFNDFGLVFGEVQSEYNSLKSSIKEYELLLTNKHRERKTQNLKKQLSYYTRLASISEIQLSLSIRDFKHTKEEYSLNKKLYKKGIISKVEFYAKEKKLTSHQQEIETLKKAYTQNQITIAEYERQLNDLIYEFEEKERQLKEKVSQGIDNIKNFINLWQLNYVLTAPFSGEITYLSNLHENQFIKVNNPLLAVIPENNQYIGDIEIPVNGFGKVKTGQTVHIKLHNYPHHEFGRLNGVVDKISKISNSNDATIGQTYLAKVKLPSRLITTYQKELEFKPEMSGTAEIVTDDLRLIERIFNQFRKILKK